ncbi:MAG: hypothetical protein AVDCRST_MAG04-3229, partial [uncultured Acetobacteraceae bacterium]
AAGPAGAVHHRLRGPFGAGRDRRRPHRAETVPRKRAGAQGFLLLGRGARGRGRSEL